MLVRPVEHVEFAHEARLVLPEDLDVEDLASLEERFQRTIQRGHDTIVLECAGVLFIDTSGLRFLVSAARAARREGVRLVLAEPTELLRRLLQLADLLDWFEFAGDERSGEAGRGPVAASGLPHQFPVAQLSADGSARSAPD